MAGNPIALNAVVEVKAFCYGLGQLGINVVHFKCDTSDGANTDVDMAAVMASLLPGPYIALISEEVEYWGTSVRILTGGTFAAFQTRVGSAAGGVAGDPLPTQISGIITKVTGLIGRANRGRMYVPFPGEADSGSSGLPTDDYVLRLQAVAGAALGPISVGLGTTLKPVLRHHDGTTTPIASADPRQKWGQQHKRGSYGQANSPPF